MEKRITTICVFMSLMMLSGCLSETIESTLDDGGVIAPEEYSWEDDGQLVIVTYDVTGLTDELISEFENTSGYDVELMKLDDAGSILNHLLQYKGNQVADLAIGLDNTYLQTAIDNEVLWQRFTNVSNISEQALVAYDGPLAVPFDQGYVP